MKQTVLITTSGVGAPLGDLTKHTNKALIQIDNKPALAHVIESYPKNTRFVVTLGYFGEQVKDFLQLAYPDRSIEYVNVHPFVGPGSSLGESMLQASHLLQSSFIFHASDTLVSEKIPAVTENWTGVAVGNDTSQYASWSLQEGKMRFHEKGALGADYIHIGLIGVRDYKAFWNTLRALKNENPDNASLNDGQVLARLVDAGAKHRMVEFSSWKDIGNVDALLKARGGSFDVLFKAGEAIFFFDKFIIKFFSDAQVAQNRAKRAKLLRGFVPNLEGARGNFYRYEFVKGRPYPEVVDVPDFKNYLAWVQNEFWGKPKKKLDDATFKEICRKFYEDKTRERVAKFFSITGLQDSAHVINGEKVPTIAEMLSMIDFSWLSDGIQSQFHGDFVLDNVVRTSKGYALVDWRQDFGGRLDVGDRYYDLTKLNHNLTVNHHAVSEDLFRVDARASSVEVSIMRPSELVECQKVLHQFIVEKGYDLHKVKILTALNWLNGAPLHHHPYNRFLYYFGKLNLWRALNEKK